MSAVNRKAFLDFVLEIVFPEGAFQLAEKRKGFYAQNMEMKCINARKVNHIEKVSLTYQNYNTSDEFYSK